MAPARDALVGRRLSDAVAALDGWEVDADDLAISRTFAFSSFKEAFAFMTVVAGEAETIDHHPEWSNVYNRVSVRLTTHSAGGVTDLDLAMAKFMNEAAAATAAEGEPAGP